MTTPFFSVLVPTRNRASLLREALPTVINQTFEDCEIIVSDNNSSDDTRAVIEEFQRLCPRIRYVNPGRDMSMCAHFDFIFEQAQGRYVTFVSDDDGLVPSALEITHRVLQSREIDLMVWNVAGFYHRDIPEKHLKGRMYGRVGSGRLYEIPSSIPAGTYTNFSFVPIFQNVPKILRMVVKREVMAECGRRTGQFHLPPFPDQSASCQFLGSLKSYFFLDLNLYIGGASFYSNAGIAYNRKQKFDEYCSLFGDDLLAGVPYPMRYINPSYWYAGVKRFKEIYPNSFQGEIQVAPYLEMQLQDLLAFQASEDISEELQEIRQNMRDFSGGNEFFEKAMKKAMGERRSMNWKRALLRIASGSAFLTNVLVTSRRLMNHVRGRKSLDRLNLPSMTRAAEVVQQVVDETYDKNKEMPVHRVSNCEELASLT